MRLHLDHHQIGRALAATGVAMIGLAMMGPASADPPGNNGTIKVDGVDFDIHPDNDPHVADCSFQVDFYGYEADVPVTMEFSVQPPTGDAVIHTVDGVLDGDDASGANEGGIDGQFTIDLSADLATFTPQPNQGYHVKLTITADDGTPQGNDSKSKVFWVEGPCEVPTTTTTSTTTTSTTSTTTTTLATTTTASVLGVTVTRAPNTGAEVLGIQLARTGFSDTMLAVGITMLGVGLAFEGAAQVARRRSTLS